ncbi:MAG: YraN family protein [Salinivirgaceae bacterium]|nr:YraN family protein [Salinivirgaceae bacterium]
MTNQEIGKLGEDAAANLLIGKGYKILERNYRSGHLEVDIIALKDDVVAFVEVKTRAVNYLVSPHEAVNYQKQKFIANAANGYMRRFNRSEEARLDVITVLHKNGAVVEVEHIENAYYPKVRTY